MKWIKKLFNAGNSKTKSLTPDLAENVRPEVSEMFQVIEREWEMFYGDPFPKNEKTLYCDRYFFRSVNDEGIVIISTGIYDGENFLRFNRNESLVFNKIVENVISAKEKDRAIKEGELLKKCLDRIIKKIR